MNVKSDAPNVYQQINELGQQVNMPNLVGLLRVAGMGRRLDMAEFAPFKPGDELGFKPGDELGFKPGDELGFKPGDELGFKPGDELSRRFGSRIGLADLPALAELANAITAMAYAKAITKDLRSLQEKLNGEDRARLQKALNHLETQIDQIESSVKRAVAASPPSRSASGSDNGRAVHVHLHLGS